VAFTPDSEETTWPYSTDPKLAERFWGKVENLNEPVGCWLYTGAVSRKGYGQFYWHHPETGRPRHDLAHRVAYFLYCGCLPRYLVHGCGNRRCVRPTHLFSGNPFKQQVPISKQRLPAIHGRSSFFTEQDAFDIRTAAARGVGEEVLARLYGVDKKDIARITMGRTFKKVEGPIRNSKHRGIKRYREEWIQQLRQAVA
jgi:hypothetical protein